MYTDELILMFSTFSLVCGVGLYNINNSKYVHLV